MKTLTFVIMTVLIFGVAASPVLQNGLAFAQTNEEKKSQRATEMEEKRAEKQAISDEKKSQRATEMEEKRAEKQAISDEKKSQRATEMEEKRAKFLEKFSNMSDELKQKLQERLDKMKEKRSSMNLDGSVKEKFAGLDADERHVEIQKIRDERMLERELRQNMTTEERQAHIAELQERMIQQRESHVSPFGQMSLGLDPADIVCSEGKELVIKVSNDMPRCLGHDTAITLIDRGLVMYPQ